MDRNTLLAFLLISVVLILTPRYLELINPPQEGRKPLPNKQSATAKTIYDVEPQSGKNILNEEKTFLPQGFSPEKTTKIETDLYIATVSNIAGGSIKEFFIKEHKTADSNLVNLINPEKAFGPIVEAKDLDGNPLNLSTPWLLDSYEPTRILTEDLTLSYKKEIFNNTFLYKHLTFSPENYTIDISIDLSSAENDLYREASIVWTNGLAVTEKNKTEDLTYFQSYVFQGGELEDFKASENKKSNVVFNGATTWAATRTKYFTAALIPSDPFLVKRAEVSGIKKIAEYYDLKLTYDSRDDLSVLLYLGPLEYGKIKDLGVGLDEIMDFGWAFIRPISKGVLYVLTEMYKVIPNYGLVLIVFSFLIKILVYPLTKKSYQSTTAMQALQPEISKLKEKHKSNPQKLNQATMELYKKKGVNPLGGCLPMLLQMPLLFALFIVFRTTIELRSKPFMWWITDLSAPDKILELPFTIPIYGSYVAALPILMVVSMFVQQKMMAGPSQQPQQKMMQYTMSFFFFFIFNSFPSGLNLYYTLFNILTIAQQKMVKQEPKKEQ